MSHQRRQTRPFRLPEFSWQLLTINRFPQPEPQQIITSFMTLGSIIGALLTGPIGAHLSRRYCLMGSSALLIAAVAIMSETTSFGALYFARLLCGLANGVLMNFAFVYLQECTPPYLRGLCFGMAAFWITFGSTMGMVRLTKPSRGFCRPIRFKTLS